MTYLEFVACIFLIWILIYSIFFKTKYYKEYEAAQIHVVYDEENVTHLLTNEGKLYRSTHSKHAVIVFTGKAKPDKMKTIWIKRFPCAHCSQIHCIKQFLSLLKSNQAELIPGSRERSVYSRSVSPEL